MREERDDKRRFRAGASGNPKGRRPAGAFARLLSAAARAGAQIVVLVPPAAESDASVPTPPAVA